MKKLAIGISLVCAAALVALSAGPGVSQPPEERRTITLFDPNKTDYERHVRGSGAPFSPGDWHVYVDRLLDPETCDVAARVVGRFLFVKRVGKQDAWLINDFTAVFSDGKVAGYGAAKFSDFAGDEPVFPITGGTGAYRDASGELGFGTQPVGLCGTRGLLSTLDLGPAT